VGAAIKVPELIALCSTLVALGAFILTAYLARMTLRHQQTEAHRDRVWERKTDALLDFLQWIETDAAVGDVEGEVVDPSDRAPRLPAALYVRLKVFTPDGFMSELRLASEAVDEWRHAVAPFLEGKGSLKDVTDAQGEAGRHLGRMRLLAQEEIRNPPHIAERRTPALLNAIKRQRERESKDSQSAVPDERAGAGG
jgi:hypothetical protein